MIYLITGASHVGKTALAQRLLEQYQYPYLSIDHLKMGLIRSGYTDLTPLSEDDKLTEYLWPIVREMIKTAMENGQNLIVEGCYIPFDWEKSFSAEEQKKIRYLCLVMTENYIKTNFQKIRDYACVIEERQDDSDLRLESVIQDNANFLSQAKKHNLPYILIDEDYKIDL